MTFACDVTNVTTFLHQICYLPATLINSNIVTRDCCRCVIHYLPTILINLNIFTIIGVLQSMQMLWPTSCNMHVMDLSHFTETNSFCFITKSNNHNQIVMPEIIFINESPKARSISWMLDHWFVYSITLVFIYQTNANIAVVVMLSTLINSTNVYNLINYLI